jgi:hypothetical protein
MAFFKQSTVAVLDRNVSVEYRMLAEYRKMLGVHRIEYSDFSSGQCLGYFLIGKRLLRLL